MVKLYSIQYGFYSGMENSEISSIWSTKEKALIELMQEVNYKSLDQVKHKKTGELLECWTDGDYCVTIVEMNLDTPYLYGDLND